MPVEYEETFKFGLMEVVFEWARGMVSSYYGCTLNIFGDLSPIALRVAKTLGVLATLSAKWLASYQS